MKKLIYAVLAASTLFMPHQSADACTNLIVTHGASKSGSVLVTYAADSHNLYGALYQSPRATYAAGTMLDVYEWDTQKYLGCIPQVESTYSTIGNMNEVGLVISETTFGGRRELRDSKGVMDYGSLIYITLQRASTAREAIQTIVDLANTHGYMSSGESFSIADQNEVWIMELIGKGEKYNKKGANVNKGIVWVARRVPDGYVSAHANHARITTFPQDDPENTLFAPDVVSFAREMGFYSGSDAEFNFADTYSPIGFNSMRYCDARVWSFFRKVADDMDQYVDYAMGHNQNNRLPLWVKPRAKVSQKELFDAMRDHYEDTPMDMTTDLGAGGHGLPYRWRPMTFEVDGETYCNERAIATQQTGFWFTAEIRPDVDADMSGILWFGVDDAGTSCLTPFYGSTATVPYSFSEENGSMLEWTPTSAFWLFNTVTNFAYMRYDMISKDILMVVDAWENERLAEISDIDEMAKKLDPLSRRDYLTNYSVARADELVARWQKLQAYLMVKYVDGNAKCEHGTVLDYLSSPSPATHFINNGNRGNVPGDVEFPGYNEKWKRAVVEDNGKVLKVHTVE